VFVLLGGGVPVFVVLLYFSVYSVVLFVLFVLGCGVVVFVLCCGVVVFVFFIPVFVLWFIPGALFVWVLFCLFRLSRCCYVIFPGVGFANYAC